MSLLRKLSPRVHESSCSCSQSRAAQRERSQMTLDYMRRKDASLTLRVCVCVCGAALEVVIEDAGEVVVYEQRIPIHVIHTVDIAGGDLITCILFYRFHSTHHRATHPRAQLHHTHHASGTRPRSGQGDRTTRRQTRRLACKPAHAALQR